MPLSHKQLTKLRATTGGNRIAVARQLSQLTQVQLAAALGISQSSLSDLERSRYRALTVETAQKFSTYFGCSIEDLFPATPREAVAS